MWPLRCDERDIDPDPDAGLWSIPLSCSKRGAVSCVLSNYYCTVCVDLSALKILTEMNARLLAAACQGDSAEVLHLLASGAIAASVDSVSSFNDQLIYPYQLSLRDVLSIAPATGTRQQPSLLLGSCNNGLCTHISVRAEYI